MAEQSCQEVLNPKLRRFQANDQEPSLNPRLKKAKKALMDQIFDMIAKARAQDFAKKKAAGAEQEVIEVVEAIQEDGEDDGAVEAGEEEVRSHIHNRKLAATGRFSGISPSKSICGCAKHSISH